VQGWLARLGEYHHLTKVSSLRRILFRSYHLGGTIIFVQRSSTGTFGNE